jgi:adenosylhomocysteine nucleosidase
MVSETDRILNRLEQDRREQIGDWSFWCGRVDGYPVIVSRANIGGGPRCGSDAVSN